MENVVNMNTGFIVLEHDLFQQTVEVATGYILPDALARRPALNITTVNSCLNRPPGDAYLETNDNSSNPLPLSGASPSSVTNSLFSDELLQPTRVQIRAAAAQVVPKRTEPLLGLLGGWMLSLLLLPAACLVLWYPFFEPCLQLDWT